MQIYVDKIFLDNYVEEISTRFNYEIVFEKPYTKNYFIYDTNGLSFILGSNNTTKLINVNFMSGKLGWRLKRADHEGNLKKALGRTKNSLVIFDATAGLLSDSMIFLSLGHKVVAVEQSKIIFLLVDDAIKRAKNEIPFLKNINLINANSLDIYKSSQELFDIVYLDPMYPISKKNIKKSGDLDSLRSILEIENILNEENSLINSFMKEDYQKLILKRPLKAKKLHSNINYQVKGKSTRFDIYL
ncbi:MAG: hypothetical protein CMD79_03585 [Gammaproteobacteria bacterium]|nr:hypothetical protein [Gammaproteobacteria bacterium]|tara:strand:- start:1193 stop:1924 length:732 start_codon:yes stop_codon:yes gene_type:complete